MALTKGFIRTAGTDAIDARFFTAGLLQKNLNNTVRLGELWGSTTAVAATSSMNVTVADGTYWVVSRGVTDGATVIANSGAATLPIATAPSANSRIDAVYVKHNDAAFGDSNSDPMFGVVTGVAAASPTAPAVPAGALLLATVLVPAGVTATNASGVVITNSVPFTSLSGTPIRYRSFSDMVADAPNVVEGALAYIRGGGSYYLRGGAWRRSDAAAFAFSAQTNSTPLVSGSTLILLGGSAPSASQSSDTQYVDVPSAAAIGPVKVAGWYDVSAQVTWTTNSTGERYIEIQQNDTSVVPQIADRRAASGSSNQSVLGQVYLNVGDYVKLKGWQSSGSQINYLSRLSIKYVS